MDCRKNVNGHFFLNLLFTTLLFFVTPVQASTGNFTFVEYNIAFILGLSLPLILFSALINQKISIQWPFTVFITASVLIIFYSIAYLTIQQDKIILTGASLFISLLFLWPFYNATDKTIEILPLQVQRLFKYSIIIITALFLGGIWVEMPIDAFNSWLVYSAILLVISLIRLLYIVKRKRFSFGRILVQWVLSAFFCGAIYLWLNTEIDVIPLTIITGLTYLSTLINGCWFLVQHLYKQIQEIPITVQKKTEDELFSYTHDPSTHLPNYQKALQHFEQHQKNNLQNKYAAIVLKPINFQQVNTVLGHHNSDILLLQLAYSLQQFVADNEKLLDLDNHTQPVRIARLQGLLFLIVYDLTDNHHPENTVIDDVCNKIAESVPNAMSFKSFSLNFELAFGVAISGKHGSSIAELIAHAGDALIEIDDDVSAVHYFDNQKSIYSEQQLAKMEVLKQDILTENFQWLLQPQINQTSKKIHGLELTIQWNYQQNSPYLLPEFRKLAELSGEVYSLTKLMITQAFRLLMSIQKQGIYQPITINISSKDLLEPDLADFIEKQINNFHISGKYLMISLDEDIVVKASSQSKAMIDHLKALDLTIAIAEFSGSYEALRYLRKMAINEIKINCSQLVDNIENATDKAIINALINLTRKMHLPLVGTQINNVQIEQAFIAMGGEYIQGSYVGNYINAEEILAWLNKWFTQYPNAKP